MYSAYKKFTAQDIGQVPFNAYKQYNLSSSKFLESSIEIYTTTWSSASIETFSTGALNGVYPTADTANSLRYFQLDHLFYKDFNVYKFVLLLFQSLLEFRRISLIEYNLLLFKESPNGTTFFFFRFTIYNLVIKK